MKTKTGDLVKHFTHFPLTIRNNKCATFELEIAYKKYTILRYWYSLQFFLDCIENKKCLPIIDKDPLCLHYPGMRTKEFKTSWNIE